MKKTKSIVALVLAVVLVFALSASAFATGNPVSVSIQWEGEEVYYADVYTTDVDLYKSQLRADYLAKLEDPSDPLYNSPDDGRFTSHLYTIPSPVPTGYTLTYPNDYTGGDVLIAAWVKASNYVNAPAANGTYAYSWSANTNYYDENIFGMYFTTYGGLPTYGNYYLVSTRVENNVTYYTYVWAGYAWSLTIDNYDVINYGACDYAMSDISSITFNYYWEETASFELDYYIPGTLPYSDLNN